MLPGQQIGHKGSAEYPQCSLVSTPLDFTCGGPSTLLRLCATMTFPSVVPTLVHQTQKCLQTNDGHFEHFF
jgi:hypothetical protein